ncbi:MAG TPA: class I SAM-dependent methyltransferase [Ignavibacteria bacterium]|nr:class I SAM-dependent methyltransferase [Ignavibacteria bacterium]HMR41483.1 class I SAM-dependent methyltransferase [Ignavibacteria bacterium]
MQITKPVRKWVKQKIKNTYIEIESSKVPIEKKIEKILDIKKRQILEKNIESAIYFPYKEDSDSYVITGEKEYSEVCENGLPIPPQNLWLGYGNTTKEYLYGRIQTEKMIKILDNADFDINYCKRILDFGCGAGRMLRWLFPYSNTAEIWGTDISSDHITWANNFLKPPFNFATTTTIPHLPFEDNYFNLIYAGSVFTHIDDLVESWLLELRRIINTNGRVYITVNDKHSLKLLKTSKIYVKIWLSQYVRENQTFINAGDNFLKIVGMRGTRSQVFYDIEYFCESINNLFDVVSVNKEAYGFQTGILLKKK